MPSLDLTDQETVILKHLLRMGSEEFARHGCNDFNIQEELGIPKADALLLAQHLHEEMLKLKVDDDHEYSPSIYAIDWQLFALFEAKLASLLTPPQPLPSPP